MSILDYSSHEQNMLRRSFDTLGRPYMKQILSFRYVVQRNHRNNSNSVLLVTLIDRKQDLSKNYRISHRVNLVCLASVRQNSGPRFFRVAVTSTRPTPKSIPRSAVCRWTRSSALLGSYFILRCWIFKRTSLILPSLPLWFLLPAWFEAAHVELGFAKRMV